MTELQTKLHAALNRLTKWRTVFAGWQLGTRSDKDPECAALRDHREVTMLLRAESSALVSVLVEKGLFTEEEFQAALLKEADLLSKNYESKFPGFKATDVGITMNAHIARDTMSGWRP